MRLLFILSILLMYAVVCKSYNQYELEVKFMTEFGPAMLNKTYNYYRYLTTNDLASPKNMYLTIPDQSYSLPDFNDTEIDTLPTATLDSRCPTGKYMFFGETKCMTKSESFLTIDPCACVWNNYEKTCHAADSQSCWLRPSATYGFYTMIVEATVPYNNSYLQIYNKCDYTDTGYGQKINLKSGKNKLYINNKTRKIGRVNSLEASGGCEIIAKTNSDNLKLTIHTYSIGYLYITTSLNENSSSCVIFNNCYKLLC